MKISKFFIKQIFEETIQEFNQKVFPIENKIELKFQDKEEFLNSAKEDQTNALYIQNGIYKNFDSEYASFLVVYSKDKDIMREILGIPYYITICYEIADNKLKPFNKNEVKEYLKHGFAHGLTHIYEDRIKKKEEKLWLSLLKQSKNVEYFANELLAETIADRIGKHNLFKKVENNLWSVIYKRIEKYNNQMLR